MMCSNIINSIQTGGGGKGGGVPVLTSNVYKFKSMLSMATKLTEFS